MLRLQKLKCKWYLQPCCALTKEGLVEGFDWLRHTLKHSTR